MRIILKNKDFKNVAIMEITKYPNSEMKYTLTKEDRYNVNGTLSAHIDAVGETNYEALIMGLERLTQEFNIKELIMPYIPYVRSDREIVINYNTADLCGVEIYAKYLNRFNFEKISTLVPHNVEKLKSVISTETKLNIINHTEFFKNEIDKLFNTEKEVVIVLPDKGARVNFSDDINKLSEKYKFGTITLDKVRNPKTGNLEDMKIHEMVGGVENMKEPTIIIIDDLTSRGGTFCWAIDTIQKEVGFENSKKILMVAHAEETALLGKLPEVFDLMICSDSISDLSHHEKFKVINTLV